MSVARLAFAMILPATGCPMHVPSGIQPGFVDFGAEREAAAGSAQVGVAGVGYEGPNPWSLGAAGATLRVEPRPFEGVSVPIEGSVQLISDLGVVGLGRVGFRVRATEGFAVGLGAGPSVCIADVYGCRWGGSADLELAGGRRLPRGAWSIATRPGVSAMSYGPTGTALSFSVPIELAAVFRVSDGLDFGASIVGGMGLSQEHWGGGGGLTLTFAWSGQPRD